MGIGYKTDSNADTPSKEATVFNSLPPWFGCFCYLLVGLSVSLVYVLSEVDYLMLSGVFRAQRFFSDDPFYFSKQVLIVYGFVGFLFTILVGPIGRLPCVLWSWALSSAYFCLSFYVFLYSFSQYGRFMMLALALLSLLSHVLLANFVFFLFDAGAYDFRLPRCFAFLIGFFAGSPLVSFVLFRLKLCFTTGSSYEFKLKTFDIFRLLATLFSLAMLSSLCLTYEFFAYGDNNYRIEWAPAKRVRAPVRAIAQFVDGEVVVLLFLLCPMWVDLGQYAANTHGDWVEARLGHKAMFAVALIALLLWTFASTWQLCVHTINEINAAIFKVMFTDGYEHLKDGMKDIPVSVTPITNYQQDCKNAEKKIKNTLTVPGPVMYPYLQDTWDDAENEDKLMLSTCLKMLNGIDSISHYLETGSSAELCKLTNDLNLKDCWLESQDPLTLIDHILKEYNNTLTAMVGNSLNLQNKFDVCSGFKHQYLGYLTQVYSHYTENFCVLVKEIESLLKCVKSVHKTDIQILSRLVCCYVERIRCFKCLVDSVIVFVSEIDSKLKLIEEKIKKILNEFNVSVSTDVVLERYGNRIFAVFQQVMVQKDVILCKQSVSEIKNTIKKCNIQVLITQLTLLDNKLCELDQKEPFVYMFLSNIDHIIKTTCEICNLRSPLNTMLCELQNLQTNLTHITIHFQFRVMVRIRVPPFVRVRLSMYIENSFQKHIPCLMMLLKHVNSKILQLRANICEINQQKDCVCMFFKCVAYWNCRFMRIKCFMNSLDCSVALPTPNFLKCSNTSNTRVLGDLIQRISPSRARDGSHRGSDFLSHSLISLGSSSKDLIWPIFSHMVIVETKLLVSRLYSAIQKTQLVLGNIINVDCCCCCSTFKSMCQIQQPNDCIYYFSTSCMTEYRDKMQSYFKKIDKMDKHLCLCLIIKYILYPNITLCLCYLLNIELNISCLLTRKYEKYSEPGSHVFGASKLLILAIDIFLKTTNWIRGRYICCCDKNECCKRDNTKCVPECIRCTLLNECCSDEYSSSDVNSTCCTSKCGLKCSYCCVHHKNTNCICPQCKQNSPQVCKCCCNCFCNCTNDSYYIFFISLILYICYLIENIPQMTNIRIQETSQRLSSLIFWLNMTGCCKIVQINLKSQRTNNILLLSVPDEMYIPPTLSNGCIKLKTKFRSSNFHLLAITGSTEVLFSMLDSMLTITISKDYINIVYQKISLLSFLIANSGCAVFASTSLEHSLTSITLKYISSISKPNGTCECKHEEFNVCKCCRTVAKCLTLANVHLNLIIWHISNSYNIEMITILDEDNKGGMKYILDSNSSCCENLLKKTKHARILDATCSLGNTSQQRVTDLNPKYYVSDKVFRPSGCFGFGYFKFVITRFFLVVFLILMFWFLRFRFDPFVPGAFSQLRNYDYAATSAHLTSLIAQSQNAANSQSSSDVTDTSGVRDAANVGIGKPRLKKAKHFVLIGAFAAVSAVYIVLVIRDIYVAVTVDFTTLSYLINVAIVCGMFMTVFIKYFIHLYDFVQVLQRYGVKLTRASTFLDTAAHGGSHAVMLLSLVKTMGADLTSLALLKRPRTSSSSYSDMKNTLFPYNAMTVPIRRMTTADSDHLKELESLRQTVLASLGDAKKFDDRNDRTGKKTDNSAGKAGNTLDLHSVLDFLSYVLMSKTSAFHYHTFSADDAYLSWRLGRPINHNFFLLAYTRYTAVYELYARTQAFNFGEFYTAEQNCNRLWRAFGDAQIDAISLSCMAEDALLTPMTQLQTQMLKAKIAEEYLHSFIGFQTFVASTVFGVKTKNDSGLSTDSLFPFVHAFNKLELDSELVTRLATKFFGDTQRKVSAGVAVPSSTCALDGDAQRVRDRLTQSCAEWLDKKRHCCESLAGAGCDCIVHRAHDMVLKAIAEPGDVRDNTVTLVAGLNLEEVEVLDKSFETDVGAKRALKDFSTTLLEHRSLDAVSHDYESTVAHYLNAYLVSTYENRDRAAVPLGLYMQWHGAPLCETHLRNVDKFDHFI